MASTLNAISTGAGGIITTGDSTGLIALQSNGTTVLTTNSTGAIGVGSSPSYGTSGQLLTSGGSAAAPTWTTVSSGGMTLLGTLTTTSGTTQTLSGLTLTNYKFLQISFNNVGFTSGASSQLKLGSTGITAGGYLDTATAAWGILFIDLASGAAGVVGAGSGQVATNTTNFMDFHPTVGTAGGNLAAITTSSTSLSFTFSSGNTFASGTIKVYGVA
jgi:hypothetical protein